MIKIIFKIMLKVFWIYLFWFKVVDRKHGKCVSLLQLHVAFRQQITSASGIHQNASKRKVGLSQVFLNDHVKNLGGVSKNVSVCLIVAITCSFSATDNLSIRHTSKCIKTEGRFVTSISERSRQESGWCCKTARTTKTTLSFYLGGFLLA